MPSRPRDYGAFSLSTLLSQTKFIVGIRHPILWFESFYNFRIHNKVRMPPAEELVGNCGGRMHGVCTRRGNFHFFSGTWERPTL